MTYYDVAKRGICEVRGPVVRADGDEIDSIAQIIPGSEADILPVEHYINRVTV